MCNRLKNFFPKSQRRKVTLKKRGKTLTFEGKEVKKLQEYDAYCPLLDEEEKAFEQLKERISKLNLYCTFEEFDRFLNNVLLTGNCPNFIEAFESFARENAADNYLLDCRKFYVATSKGSPS